jgi:hypothetical protein
MKRAGLVEPTILAGILALGLALRLSHLSWGLPDYVHYDSLIHFIRPAAILVANRDFTLSTLQFAHGPLLVYVLGGVYLMFSLLTGEPIRPDALTAAGQLPTLVMLGRGLAVAIALLSVMVQYLLARRLLGVPGALCAAAAFSLAPIPVLESHRINPNGAMILLMLLASYLAVVAHGRKSPWCLMGAFAVAGLAGAVKYVGPFAGAVPAWIALTWPGSGRQRRVLVFTGALVALLALCVGLLPAAFHRDQFLAMLTIFARVGFVQGAPGYGFPAEGWTSYRFVYGLFVALPFVLGWPVYLASLAGLIVLFRRSRFAFGVAVAFLLPFFLMQGGAALVVARYFEPLVPFLALAAGAALSALWEARPRLGVVVAAAVLLYTLGLSASQVARLDEAPQRAAAAFIAKRAAASDGTLGVGYWGRWTLVYDVLRPMLQKLPVHVEQIPDVYQGIESEEALPADEEERLEFDRRWVEEHDVQLIVLPSWAKYHFTREVEDTALAGFYRRLVDGRLGFRPGPRFDSHFFTQSLYTWGDPMLNGHWETGIAGYEIILREPASP